MWLGENGLKASQGQSTGCPPLKSRFLGDAVRGCWAARPWCSGAAGWQNTQDVDFKHIRSQTEQLVEVPAGRAITMCGRTSSSNWDTLLALKPL